MRESGFSALSVDVEDGISIWMRDLLNVDIPPTDRVVDNVNILLNLFSKSGTRATFFILGEIACSFPHLVRSIASEGHELGVHGYHHDQFFRLTPQKAKEDIYKAKSLIEDISGRQVFGFRAPAFSIREDTRWGLEIIAEVGFRYDSSIVPASGKRYGWDTISRDIHRLKLENGNTIIEVPLSVTELLGKIVPACGGGYMRYFPYWYTRQTFRKIKRERPVIVYLHPYELDTNSYPDFFHEALASTGLIRRISLSFYRFNKGTVKAKLSRLMNEFKLKTINEILDDMERESSIPVNSI